MKKIKVYIVDAFTNIAFQGNPAGVVFLDEELKHEKMQKIAKEINQSETVFLLKSTTDDYDYRVFYFTPTDEIDFCGHATIACSFIIGSEVYSKNRLRLMTNIGVIPVDLTYKDSRLDQVMLTQIQPEFKLFNENLNDLFSILGINLNEYDYRVNVFYGYTGNWDLFIPIKSRKAIENANPNFDLLKKHNIKHEVTSVHLFTFDSKTPHLLYTRNFGPSVGINEDYVTGSSNGAMVAFLQKEKLLKEEEFYILQGNKGVRTGEIKVKIEQQAIKLGGNALKIIEGYINI